MIGIFEKQKVLRSIQILNGERRIEDIRAHKKYQKAIYKEHLEREKSNGHGYTIHYKQIDKR